jgi:hypothetical protein
MHAITYEPGFEVPGAFHHAAHDFVFLFGFHLKELRSAIDCDDHVRPRELPSMLDKKPQQMDILECATVRYPSITLLSSSWLPTWDN